MDNPQKSPRFAHYHKIQSAPVIASADKQVVAMHIPQNVPQLFGSTPKVAEIPDFKIRAKAYKKAFIKYRLLKISIIIGIFIAFIALILGSIGFVLNAKYSGRSLPYTYVGSLAIGGLTQSQIKNALDKKAQSVTINLQEGGLIREVPATSLGVTFDTEQASKNAITGFNPFGYLHKRSIEVPVSVNALTVDGYMRMQVANMQTKNQNAQIVKDKKGFAIVPEVNGFKSSSAYVADQIKKQLVTIEDTTISLTASTDKPSVTSADLQDDVELAKQIVSTKISLDVGGKLLYPSDDVKFSWLQVVEATGANNAGLQLSEEKIKAYVYEQASKLHTEPKNESIETKPDGSQYIKPGQNGRTVNNSDDVAGQIYRALSAQQPAKIAFTYDEKPFIAINRNGLVLAKAPEKPLAGPEQ